jgi:hypothetical protein
MLLDIKKSIHVKVREESVEHGKIEGERITCAICTIDGIFSFIHNPRWFEEMSA